MGKLIYIAVNSVVSLGNLIVITLINASWNSPSHGNFASFRIFITTVLHHKHKYQTVYEDCAGGLQHAGTETHAQSHIHTYISLSVCACVFMYIHTYLHICVCMCVRTYTRNTPGRARKPHKNRSARTPGAQTTAQKDVNKHHATEGFGGG